MVGGAEEEEGKLGSFSRGKGDTLVLPGSSETRRGPPAGGRQPNAAQWALDKRSERER